MSKKKIIRRLLNFLGYDFGLYDYPEQVGYDGWLETPEKLIFFGPQVAVIEP